MIDLHSHILPGIDDGARDLDMALAMARASVANGVKVQACTPHIMPGVYDNTGPAIIEAVIRLQEVIDREGIPLRLVAGADVHLVPDMVGGLRSGHLLSLANSRYVLVEPPHHVAPARMDDAFFALLSAGYVPVLTHPERLSWIEGAYDTIVRLARSGVWMQITAGSLTGSFGKAPRYWAERMLEEGHVHILASDSHNLARRRPDLAEGRAAAAAIVGEEEADHLVVTRPYGMVRNVPPGQLPIPFPSIANARGAHANARSAGYDSRERVRKPDYAAYGDDPYDGGLFGRMRRIFRRDV